MVEMVSRVDYRNLLRIHISHRIISIEGARKPIDYYDAILRMGELEVLQADFARRLAPVAGFRNVLVHEYVAVDRACFLFWVVGLCRPQGEKRGTPKATSAASSGAAR